MTESIAPAHHRASGSLADRGDAINALDVREVLRDPGQGGAYFVDARETVALAEAAAALDFDVTRVELAGCRDRDAVLQRFAHALRFAAAPGAGFELLSARLAERSARPGRVLLLEHADEWRQADDDNFAALLDVLNEAAVESGDAGVPFWALLPLPEEHVAKLAS